MNMLRVWGGGVYPPDSFYDSCDEAGIMVWQDFMFACTMIPTDEAFFDNVRLEAREQALRLRHHPSLVLWCGNNEIEKAWQAWGWQGMYNLHGADSAAVFDAYRHVFHDVLPTEVQRAGQTTYLPSSPTLDVASGDVHAWGIWFGKETFDYYSRHEGRFASEYGLQSLPNLLTLQEAGIQGFHDEALQFRQRCQMDWLEPGFDGWDMMSHYMSKTTGSPRQGNLEDWIFKSQATQAEGIRQALERHRTSNGRYAGSLYWSLNDVWPAVSWSTVDHAGRKKLGHHAAKRANAPRTLLWKRDEIDRFQLAAFNDSTSMWVDTVTVKLCAMDGTVLREVIKPLAMSGRSQSILDLGTGWTDDPANTFWCWTASNRSGSGLWSTPLDVNLGQANITMSQSGQTLTLETDRYVPYACLVSDADLRFEDNGFDLIPGEIKDVEIQAVKGNPTIRFPHPCLEWIAPMERPLRPPAQLDCSHGFCRWKSPRKPMAPSFCKATQPCRHVGEFCSDSVSLWNEPTFC
jgi:beta-mannosidase